ncbi:GTP cyclohydrolase I [Bacteroidetes/Chlorobi group bacterium MS-B_bin-24]|jgi:GTP cyclohydrolase I|nr:MAG: GTP cyclohydrolase I [Bacteroidetes/Chlorobi group bacterium MS-B_bin-24]
MDSYFENEELDEFESIPDEILSTFPDQNQWGELLFDANGNMPLTPEEQEVMIQRLEQKFIEVMDILRISRRDPNSNRTPMRIARMLVKELFAGRYQEPPKSTIFPNRKKVNELIISKGITVMSVCSHHWQPISGDCAIGYIPNKYVLGISKLTRIVDWFCRRGQIQEELGEQIADYIESLIKPKALGVVIRARHYCMIARGVKGNEENSLMITSVMRGYLLTDLNLRNEFLNLIGMGYVK